MAALLEQEAILEDFFLNWARRYRVVASVEAGLKLNEASEAYFNLVEDLSLSNQRTLLSQIRILRSSNNGLANEVAVLRAEKERFKQAAAASQKMAEVRRHLRVRCRRRLKPLVWGLLDRVYMNP